MSTAAMQQGSLPRDPKSIIDHGRMGVAQWLAVIVTVGLNAMDGFDVLSISFASPGIAKDWGVDKATLGWILSMELLGMGVGSVLLGGVADKLGRRPTILGCLLAMTLGMFGAAHAGDVPTLLAWRLLTGLGIGGMLAAINAAAAEFSNLHWRSLAMAFMVIGYPVGGVIGGLVVQHLLIAGGWRDVFVFGAWATAVFIPIVWFLVPESVAFLDRQRKGGALQAINRTLSRFGHATLEALSTESATTVRLSVMDVFKPGLIAITMLAAIGYFTHVISFYYIIKWVPNLVADLGFPARAAAGVLTWANVGGATGVVLFGLIATRLSLKTVTLITLLGAGLMVIWFGRGSADLSALALVVAVTGIFTNGGIAGYYMLFAKIFPTHVRATGTGFAIGAGRGGAALAPILAGYLFQAGFGLQTVSVMMAAGSLLSAVALLMLKVREAD